MIGSRSVARPSDMHIYVHHMHVCTHAQHTQICTYTHTHTHASENLYTYKELPFAAHRISEVLKLQKLFQVDGLVIDSSLVA